MIQGGTVAPLQRQRGLPRAVRLPAPNDVHGGNITPIFRKSSPKIFCTRFRPQRTIQTIKHILCNAAPPPPPRTAERSPDHLTGPPGPGGGPLKLWWVPWDLRARYFFFFGFHLRLQTLRGPTMSSEGPFGLLRGPLQTLRGPPYELRGVNAFRGHQSTCWSLQTIPSGTLRIPSGAETAPSRLKGGAMAPIPPPLDPPLTYISNCFSVRPAETWPISEGIICATALITARRPIWLAALPSWKKIMDPPCFKGTVPP